MQLILWDYVRVCNGRRFFLAGAGQIAQTVGMNRLQNPSRDIQRLRLEADLAARMEALFRGWPMLRGFSVEGGPEVTRAGARGSLGDELYFANLACYPTLDRDQSVELCEQIASVILELVDERPEAVEMLRGRTFARTLN